MKHRWLVATALVAGVTAGAMRADAFDDKAVKAAIDKGVAFLWRTQKADGSWGEYGSPAKGGHNYHKTGPSALACYALLECGESPQAPKMDRALKWIANYKEDGTYSLGLRCTVWEVANLPAGTRLK